MRNYTTTSENYARTTGVKRIYLRDPRGELRLSLKTDKQLKELRARGVRIYDSKSE